MAGPDPTRCSVCPNADACADAGVCTAAQRHLRRAERLRAKLQLFDAHRSRLAEKIADHEDRAQQLEIERLSSDERPDIGAVSSGALLRGWWQAIRGRQ